MARKKRSKKKNPLPKGSRRAKLAGRRAARTRARKAEARSRAARKAARTRARRHGRKAPKRRSPRRRSSKRRGHKRSRASVRKGVATRARRRKQLPEHMESHGVVYERKRRRTRRKKHAAEAAEAPRRRKGKRKARKSTRRSSKRRSYRRKRPGHRRHAVRGHRRRGSRGRRGAYVRRHMSHEEARRHKKRNPRRNPINGAKEMLAGVFGVAFGYVLASGADRYAVTHALASGQDAPAQGDIYNSEAVSLPIWSSWKRLLVGVASVGAPLVVASWVKGPGTKSFFQLAAFGALARTAGKAADDGIAYFAAKMTTPSPTLVRLYAPEMASVARVAAASVAQLPSAPQATFAGLPAAQRPRVFAKDMFGTLTPATVGIVNGQEAWVCPAGSTLVTDAQGQNGQCNDIPPPGASGGDGGSPLPPLPPEPPAPPAVTAPPVALPPPPAAAQPPVPPTASPTAPPTVPYNPLFSPCADAEVC